MKISFICLIFLLHVTCRLSAQQSGYKKAITGSKWQVIGTTQVNFGTDHSSIIVHSPFNRFRSIKFKTGAAAFRLLKTVITYNLGFPDNIEIIKMIDKGGESPVINISDTGDRVVKKIDFWYDSLDKTNHKVDVILLAMN